MENPSFYDVFETLWQKILSKFNSYALNETLGEHMEDQENPHVVTAEQAGALSIAGGIMEGEIDMNYQTLTGLPDPMNDNEAATKAYVDRAIEGVDTSDKISKSGDSMLGELSMGGHKITTLSNPTSNTDAANKLYVDNQIKSIDIAGQFNTLSADLIDQMATKIGFVELWKNPNPNSSFSSQYIYPSNLSDYLVFAIVTNTGTFFYSTMSDEDQTMVHMTIDQADGTLKLNMRQVWVSGNTLWFSYMYKENLDDNNGYDTDNQSYLVPYGVYGVCKK